MERPIVVMENDATSLKGDIETKARDKRTTKIRRTDEELQHDILKYKELLMRDQGLELDIPPKRSKTNGKEQEIKSVKYRQSSRSARYRNRRIALENSPAREISICPQDKLNEAAKGYEKLKPKYFSQHQKNIPRYQSSEKQGKIAPPSLTDINNFRTFENKVLLSHSYQELIKLLKTEINFKKVDENENGGSEAIDIPLLWNFFPKNIDAEKKRFDISDPYSFDFQSLNLSSTNLFCSEDIDAFFQKLNDSSNFDQFNEVDLEIDAESSIRKNLKETIPLA